MSEQYQSNALWPAGVYPGMYGNNISSDIHHSEDYAKAICESLERHGFSGQHEQFPIATWVSGVQECPTPPIDVVNKMLRLIASDAAQLRDQYAVIAELRKAVTELRQQMMQLKSTLQAVYSLAVEHIESPDAETIALFDMCDAMLKSHSPEPVIEKPDGDVK